jgi:hypothetical protein
LVKYNISNSTAWVLKNHIMGLEAINFFFSLKEPIKKNIEGNSEIKKFDEKHFVFSEEELFWIDIELQNEFTLSIRITLCNPVDSVLKSLDRLLLFLFSFEGGVLNNLNTKEVFKSYDEYAKKRVIESYMKRKRVFESMYGDYTAAISSEEFYRIQRANRGIEE